MNLWNKFWGICEHDYHIIVKCIFNYVDIDICGEAKVFLFECSNCKSRKYEIIGDISLDIKRILIKWQFHEYTTKQVEDMLNTLCIDCEICC